MDIDRLDIIISAEASKAEKQLNKLMTALGKLSDALSGLNTSGLTGLANSVQRLSTAMQSMNAVRTTDFTRLAKNIQKLAGIDTKALNTAASSMSIIGKALTGLGPASANAQAIGDMAKNLSKLGNKSIQSAIANMPQLASSLKNMMQVLQSAPRVSTNLIRMTEAMGKLASNGNRVGSAARSLNSGFKSYGSYSDTATRKTRSLASAIGLLYAKFWVLQRALNGLFSAIEKSMDFSETVNYFEVAMRKIGNDASRKWQENGYDSAEAYSESFSKRLKELTAKMTGFQIDSDGNAVLTNQKNIGLDPDKTLQYQAQFAQMADSIGMTEEAALNTSKALTMLGADWASLRNISFDQAWEKFASALAGQSRAVRSLGIDITQATLQEYAYKYGIETAVSEMNQATKAQLRLLAILDQSKVAFGDLANTIQSPANQLRILQQNFNNLARVIGNIFLPVVANVLPYINGVVIALQRLFQWIAKLLGVKLTNINTSIGGMSDTIADLGDEDTIGDIAGSANDASDAIDKANESAKKFRKTILGFDELNILNNNSYDNTNSIKSKDKSNISSIGGSPLLDEAIADALADYEKAWNDAFNRMENKATDFADKISDSFKKIWNTAEPTREALKRLWNEGLSNLGNFTFTALKDFYSDFLVPVGRWTLGTGLPKFINITNNFLNDVNWAKINTSLKEFWKALVPFATNIGEGLIEFYNDLTSVGADFINNVVPGGLDALASALKKISPETVQKIGYGLGVLFTSISAFKGITWIGKVLGSGSALAKGLSLLSQHPYAAMAVGIGGVVVALDKFGIIDVDWEWLWGKIGQIKDILSEFIENVDVNGLSESIGNLWDAFQPFAKGFAEAFISAFDVLVNDIGAPLINGLADAFGWLSEKLGGLSPEFLEGLGESIGILAINIKTIKIGKKLTEDLLTLIARFNGIRDSLAGTGNGKPLADMISETGQALGNTVGDVGGKAEGAGNSFSGFWKNALNIGASTALFEVLTHGRNAMDEMNTAADDLTSSFGPVSQALSDLADQGIITNDQMRDMLPTLEDAKLGTFDFDKSFQNVITTLENAGISSDSFKTALSKAMQESSVVSSEYTQKINEYLGNTEQSLDDLKSTSGNTFPSIDKDVATAYGNVESTSNTTWLGSQKSVRDALKNMKSDTSTGMQQVFKNVESYMTSIYNIITNKFRWAGDRVNTLLGDMSEDVGGGLRGMNIDVQQAMNQIANSFTNLGYKIQNSLGSLYDVGRNAAQSFSNGFRSVYIPTPHINVMGYNRYQMGNSILSTPNFGVQWYSSGGFPNAGELFMARESGPELIGRMGRKNAVANNNQIVDGIKVGVYEAVRDAITSTASSAQGNKANVTVVLEGDAKGLFKVVKTEGEKYQKSTGKPVFA